MTNNNHYLLLLSSHEGLFCMIQIFDFEPVLCHLSSSIEHIKFGTVLLLKNDISINGVSFFDVSGIEKHLKNIGKL